jgi:NADPH-dependent ferric siderophore reductase
MSSELAGRRLQTEKVTHIPTLRLVEVLKKEQIHPELIRVTFGGASLCDFRSDGFDDHIRVFFPVQGNPFTQLPQMGAQGPVFSEGGLKPILRDYTPHHHDAVNQTLQVDFFLHPGGIGSAWARAAEIGNRLILGGPRNSFVVRDSFEENLLIGDDTALPAIRRRLSELSSQSRVTVIAEVGSEASTEPFDTNAHLKVFWIYRNRARTVSDVLAALPYFSGRCWAWVAGETSDIKAIGALLMERGIDPGLLKTVSYWRRDAIPISDIQP